MNSTKKVTFADDCGKQLTFVHMIPCDNKGRHVLPKSKEAVNFRNKDMKFHIQYKDSKAMKNMVKIIERNEEKMSEISEKIWGITNGRATGDVFELCGIHEDLYILSGIFAKKRDDTLRVVLEHNMTKYDCVC